MSKDFVLKKGLDIPVAGAAELRVSKTIAPGIVAVEPTSFKGFLPRLLVAEGDSVLCGSPVLADKKNPDILLASPVSGTVREIVRGEKRKLLAVLIESDGKQAALDFGVRDAGALDAEQVRTALLQSGLWPWLVQRPYASSPTRPSGPVTSSSPLSTPHPSRLTSTSASARKRKPSRPALTPSPN